jgi:hypothetical protein
LKNTRTKNKIYENEANIRNIQKRFMNKLLNTKVGRIVDAIGKWKGLPERINKKKYKKYNQFERGLHDFFTTTMKRSYVAIKNEL